MIDDVFSAAIGRITSGQLALDALMQAGQQLAGAGRPDLSRQLYQVWISFNPQHPLIYVAHFNCSTLMEALGDPASAEAELRKALAANTEFAPARINLGGLIERRGAADAAVAEWRFGASRLAAVTGDSISYKQTFLKQISRVLMDQHALGEAEMVMRQSLEISIDQRDVLEQYVASRLAQCKWPPLDDLPKLPRQQMLGRLHPLSICSYTDDPMLQLGVADNYVRAMAPIAERSMAQDRRDAAIAAGRKLKIGYVSSDLRFHAVGFLIAEVFDLHDQDAFEIHAYYSGIPTTDPLWTRIKTAATAWTDIRPMSDDEAAAKIAADEIDILIDVNGHTRDARLGIFARRPAPIQVNWLGFPGTMGSPFHQYIVADDVIIPPGSEKYYSEHVLRLPCYQPNDRQRIVADDRPTREVAGLPEDKFVFCSFNAGHKITRYSFARWMEILARAPESVLWLLDYGEPVHARLRAAAEARGIDPARLIFAQKLANPYHLARLPLADLVLDTAPYGAHTTASDALWMGVPVLTIAGRCFAARVCASLVTNAGLPEFVCGTEEEFISRAALYATDEQANLQAHRARLAMHRDSCTLFDTPRLVRALEELYRHMAAAHRDGVRILPELRNMEAYRDIGAAIDHEAQETGFRPDYEALYRAGVAARHLVEPMAPDSRFHTETIADDARLAPAAAQKAA